MSDSTTKSKRQRRWRRYSLRTMLIVVLVLSVWLGWMANQAAKQRRAVALVEELGGNVYYDVESFRPDHGIVFLSSARRGLISRLQRLVMLPSVEIVSLVGPSVTDEKLAELVKGLPNIEGLYLGNCPVTDGGLGNLSSLANLKQLGIIGTDATREGVARFRGQCPRVQVVYESY